MRNVVDGKITMSTGVVFKVKDVPLMAYEAIRKKIHKERPKVPIFYLEEKERDEPNPNDPGYLAAMDEWENRMYEALVDTSIMLGIEEDTVPDGIPKKDDEWTEKFKKLGIDISPVDQKDERFLSWVKLCAAPTTADLVSLYLACARNAGVTEEDVAAAAATFPGKEE